MPKILLSLDKSIKYKQPIFGRIYYKKLKRFYNYSLGTYNTKTDVIYINLNRIYKFSKLFGVDFIKEVSRTINHEYIHSILKNEHGEFVSIGLDSDIFDIDTQYDYWL